MDSLPKPHFSLGGATIYKGDCRELLPLFPRDSVDLIVTDPPYGMNWFSGRGGQGFKRIAGDNGGLDIEQTIASALMLLRPRRHVYVFGPLTPENLPLGGWAELVWDKEIVGLGDLSSPWSPQHERILFSVKTPSKKNREDGDGKLAARLRHGSVLRCARKNSKAVNRHPTEKPIPILRQMIESSSLIGETVLDPFAGSGSTLVASLIEGRKAIGIELDGRYCDVAAERIEEAASWAAMMPK